MVYLKQSILCYTVSVSTLFSWAGRPTLALSVLIFQLLLLSNLIFYASQLLNGSQKHALQWGATKTVDTALPVSMERQGRQLGKFSRSCWQRQLGSYMDLLNPLSCQGSPGICASLGSRPRCCLQCRAARDTWTAGRKWLEKGRKAPAILGRAYLKPLLALPWGNARKEIRRCPTNVLAQGPLHGHPWCVKRPGDRLSFPPAYVPLP